MTPLILTALADLQTLKCDCIIDVRAPAEYAEDHIPGAINLPVLSDAERAEVGTIYTQDSPFRARRIGAALVAHNAAQHLRGPLSDKQGSWQPLVYCWRGGQRSHAFATILDQVGWRVQLLQGGYKSYRSEVVKALYELPLPHRLMLIDGGTGTGKTAILHELAKQGAQTLDLEGLAAHRGSLFGGTGQKQPAQKMFETRIATQLAALDPDKITFAEAESSKVGERMLPPSLWAKMCSAPRIHIHAPLGARQEFLIEAYADLTSDKITMSALLDKLRPYHAASRIEGWHALVQSADWETLAGALVTEHYDPRYAKAEAQTARPTHKIILRNLGTAAIARAAADIMRLPETC